MLQNYIQQSSGLCNSPILLNHKCRVFYGKLWIRGKFWINKIIEPTSTKCKADNQDELHAIKSSILYVVAVPPLIPDTSDPVVTSHI